MNLVRYQWVIAVDLLVHIEDNNPIIEKEEKRREAQKMNNTNDFSEINSVKELKEMMDEKLQEYHRFCAEAKKRIEELRQVRGTVIKKPVWDRPLHEVGRDREPTNGNW